MQTFEQVVIRIFGVGTSSHQYLTGLITQGLQNRSCQYMIEDIYDVDQFISKGIESIPAITVNGDGVLFQFKDYDSLEQLAQAVIHHVENYHLQ